MTLTLTLTLAAFATLSILFCGPAVAQVVAPDCSTVPWGWTFNSLNQNACTVAAYLMSTCNMGSFTINSLLPGYSYTGPSGVDDSNLCKCNTVTYSLISACDACQSETWISWSEYSFNCTSTLPPSTFPNPVPAGTRVPQWALLDVTRENNWDVNKSMAVGRDPEIGAGSTISGLPSSSSTTAQSTGTSPSPTVFSGSSSAAAFTGTSTPKPSSSNAGAIAGGVIGGIAAISIAAIAVFYFLRRKRAKAPSATYTVDGVQPQMDEFQQPLSDDGTTGTYVQPSTPGTPAAPMKLYDPNDPTTFPGYQPTGPGSDVTTPSWSPYNTGAGTGSTVPTSAPGTSGYHGLPTV